jgi:hypothetical protein
MFQNVRKQFLPFQILTVALEIVHKNNIKKGSLQAETLLSLYSERCNY